MILQESLGQMRKESMHEKNEPVGWEEGPFGG